MTGQSEDMQGVLDRAWEHLLPAFAGPDDADGSDRSADSALAERLASLGLSPVPTNGVGAPIGAGQYLPAPDNALPRLTRIDVAPGHGTNPWTFTLVEEDGPLAVAARFGHWKTNDATAASAGWGGGGALLAVDVIFLETPHRLHLTLDWEELTFVARWETEPLHDLPLRSMRKPDAAGPGAERVRP